MTGYEIKQEIESSVAHFWSESYGQIYPVLRRLAAQKLATAKVERGGIRPRRVFSITSKGRDALRSWLAGPTEPGVMRQELILKLFFGAHGSPNDLVPQVESYRKRAEALLGQLKEAEEEFSGDRASEAKMRYRLMTVRAGQQLSQARIKWAHQTLAALAELSGANS